MARAATALREAGHDGADRVRTHHASSERKARRGSARHRPPPYELTAGEFDGRVGIGALAKVVDTRDLPVVDGEDVVDPIRQLKLDSQALIAECQADCHAEGRGSPITR